MGLKNLGQNVCFFNSVIQTLYSLESFREYGHKHDERHSNSAMLTIKALFANMTSYGTSIETYSLIRSFELPGYDPSRFQQYDAQECLIHLLNQIYALVPNSSVPEESLFKISSVESILCQTCYNASEKTVSDTICHIEFPNRFNQNSIESEISRLVNDPHGELLEDLYDCLICPARTNATKSKTIISISDFVIISLVVFRYDQATNTSRKLVPNLNIETHFENVLLVNITLQAVIFHHGDTPNSVHYTSAVKYGNIWHITNDERVLTIQNPNFNCTVNDQTAPEIALPPSTSSTSEIEHKNERKVYHRERIDKLLQKECNLYDAFYPLLKMSQL